PPHPARPDYGQQDLALCKCRFQTDVKTLAKGETVDIHEDVGSAKLTRQSVANTARISRHVVARVAEENSRPPTEHHEPTLTAWLQHTPRLTRRHHPVVQGPSARGLRLKQAPSAPHRHRIRRDLCAVVAEKADHLPTRQQPVDIHEEVGFAELARQPVADAV